MSRAIKLMKRPTHFCHTSGKTEIDNRLILEGDIGNEVEFQNFLSHSMTWQSKQGNPE
jgi:hypothetical protein